MQKFQDEAVTKPQTDRPLWTHSAGDRDDSAPSDGLASLAVGLRLRGYLSELDRSHLMSLAPCDRQVFLVYCGGVLHPTDGTPFPLEYIAIPEVPGGDALFSHRYQGERGGRGCAFKIQTAVINPDEPDRLLFGWFSPEPAPLEGCPDDRYSETVRRFRRAFAVAAEPVARLRRLLDEPVPTLLLDRSSGCVLACNNAAADRAGKHDRALIGLPLAQLRRLFNHPPTGHRMTMRHVSAADLELTVVTLAATAVSPRHHGRFSADFLLHPARRKLADIITAAELLLSYSSDASDENVAGPARAIALEARRLDHLVSKQLALVEAAQPETVRGDPAGRIAPAAEQVSSLLGHPCKVDIRDHCPDHSAQVEHRSLDRLAEAVLETHHTVAEQPSVTRVTFEPTGDAPDVLVRFETDVSDRTTTDSELPLRYARRLAARLGYRKFSSGLNDESRLCTEFIITTKPTMDIP